MSERWSDACRVALWLLVGLVATGAFLLILAGGVHWVVQR